MGVTQLRTDAWRLQIRRKGLPAVDKVFPSKEQAEEAMARELMQEAPKPESVTLRELWTRYEDSLEFLEKSENTRKTEQSRIRPVLEVLGDYSVENLERRPEVIYDYRDARVRSKSAKTGRVRSSTTVRLEMAALSALTAFAVTRRIVRANFMTQIARPVAKKRKRRVPSTEQGLLQHAAHNHDNRTSIPARFVLLLRWLGCRPSELAKLQRAHVNLVQRDVLFIDTKNGEDRRVHTSMEAVGLLQAQLNYANSVEAGSPYVFSTRGRKTEWNPFNFSGAVKILRSEGIVPADFHCHAMRREFISRAIEAGLPLTTIKKQTGHKSTQALEIYDEGLSTAPEIRAAIDKHEAAVKQEQLEGAVVELGRQSGMTDAAIEEILLQMGRRERKDGWVSAFSGTETKP